MVAATRPFVDQVLQVEVERLEAPAGTDVAQALASDQAFQFLTRLRGRPVGVLDFEPAPVYEQLLERYSAPSPNTSGYWTASRADYDDLGAELAPLTVDNPDSVWENAYSGDVTVNTANSDVQFRHLRPHPYIGSRTIENDVSPLPGLQVVGRYDPERLPGFNPSRGCRWRPTTRPGPNLLTRRAAEHSSTSRCCRR